MLLPPPLQERSNFVGGVFKANNLKLPLTVLYHPPDGINLFNTSSLQRQTIIIPMRVNPNAPSFTLTGRVTNARLLTSVNKCITRVFPLLVGFIVCRRHRPDEPPPLRDKR